MTEYDETDIFFKKFKTLNSDIVFFKHGKCVHLILRGSQSCGGGNRISSILISGSRLAVAALPWPGWRGATVVGVISLPSTFSPSVFSLSFDL